MTARTIPFDQGFFYSAMVYLVGREPDTKHRQGWDGIYTFRYEPQDDEDATKLANSVELLQKWLSYFEIIPFRTRCEYGRLPHPQEREEGKDYLEIHIVHPVEKQQQT